MILPQERSGFRVKEEFLGGPDMTFGRPTGLFLNIFGLLFLLRKL